MKYVQILLILLGNILLSQEVPVEAYNIIPKIVGKDTIVTELAKRSVAYRVSVGKMTKADSIRYMLVVKNRTLQFNVKSSNSAAKYLLKEDYGKESQLPQYIPKNRLNEVLESIPADGLHQDFDLHPRIKVYSGKCTGRCHEFSSPIPIMENQYLIYHLYRNGRSIKRSEFIVYTVSESGECEVDSNIMLPPFRDSVR